MRRGKGGWKRIVACAMALLVCVLTAMCGACGANGPTATIVVEDPQGYVHAEGENLVVDGQVIVLRGVNAGGYLLTEDWMTPTSLTQSTDTEHGQYEWERALTEGYGEQATRALVDAYRDAWWQESDCTNVAEMGCNVVRLPFGWRDLTDEDGNLRENAFVRLDAFVEQCERHHLYVILDLHGAYGSQNGKPHSGDTSAGCALFGNERNEDLTCRLWRAIAQHYADNVWVAGYDLLNEPEGVQGKTGEAQWALYDRLYRAIRQVDEHHLIILESCWEASDMPHPQTYGWQNVCYSYHYYNWEGATLSKTKSFLRYKAKDLAKTNHGVPVYIGEFSCFGDKACWEYTLRFFAQHGMSWTVWTYKGCIDSNWVLHKGETRTLDNIITPETDMDKALRIAKAQTTASFAPNDELIAILRQYLQ